MNAAYNSEASEVLRVCQGKLHTDVDLDYKYCSSNNEVEFIEENRYFFEQKYIKEISLDFD